MSEQRPGQVLRPRGPLAAGTYWRRRLLLGLVLLVVLVLLTRACGGDTTATSSATPSPTPVPSTTPSVAASVAPSVAPTVEPSPGPTPTPSVSPSAAEAVAQCQPADIQINLAVRGESYPAGSPVPFTISVATRGSAPCRLDIGSSSVQVVVLSGGDRIWARQDCDANGKATVTAAPGAPVAADVTWQGRRSAPGCPSGGVAARAGSYRTVVTVLGVSTPEVAFQLR